MIRTILLVPMLCAAALFAGCASMPLPLGERSVNAGQFTDANDFSNRIKEVNKRVGMLKSDTFAFFGLTELSPNLEPLLPQFVWETLNGNSPRMLAHDPAGNPLDFNKVEGWKYPFVSVKRTGAVGAPFTVEYKESGHEQGVVFVFSDGRLHKAFPSGVARVDRSDKKILLDPFNAIGGILGGALRH